MKRWMSVMRSLRLVLTPLLILVALAVVRQTRPLAYDRLVMEDGWVETAQVVVYAASGLVALHLAVLLWRRGLPARHGLAALVVAGLCGLVVLEEASWGQRWLHIDAPPWFRDHNRQAELNLHNLNHLNQHMHLIQALLAVTLLLACWFSDRSGPGRARAAYFLPALCVFGFFLAWPEAVHGNLADCRQAHPARVTCVVWRDQEPAELLTALGVLILLRHYRRPGLVEDLNR